MKHSKFVVFALFLFSIASCTKEFDNQILIEGDPIIPTAINIEADLLINVLDRSSNGLAAECIINGESYSTNAEGLLLIKSILLNIKGQTITFKADDYIEEIKYIVPSLGANLNLSVQMSKYNEFAEFDAITGGEFIVGGSTFTIPPLSIVHSSSDIYSGPVKVMAFNRLSALYASLSNSYRHNLSLSEKEMLTALENYGGYDIRLEDNEGNELFLMKGKTIKATIEVKKIENNDIAEQFDVMHYDKNLEYWSLNNTALKVGDYWETSLSKFGKLMWAVPVFSQFAEVKALDTDGVPLKNTMLFVFTEYGNPLSLFHTDNDGIGRGYIPVNSEFRIRTFQLCENPVIDQLYAPITESETLTVLEDFIAVSGEQVYHYKGIVEDCTGNPLPFSLVEFDTKPYPFHIISDENGKFNGAFLGCFSEFKTRVYNPSTNKYSAKFHFDGQEESDYDMGTLKLCE